MVVPALTTVLLSAAGVAFPQIGTSRIVLATVTDAKGRTLANLGEDDFVVHESDEEREVLSVRLADYPIVLLVDNAHSPASDFEAIRRAAARFVARIGRERAVAIGALAHPSTMLTSFEDDRARVTAAVDALTSETGTSSLLQGVADAARVIRATEAPFSAIVVISAADLNVPAVGTADLLTPVLSGRHAVHVIARTAPGAGGQAGTLDDSLRVLSEQTRGQFTAIFSIVSYQAALDRLADRLSSEMMIEFIEPPGAVPGDDVKVGVRIPGARVTGRGVSK